jgi:hypothetical protein
MKQVPYTSTIGSLMYVMICTRLDITHIIGVVSRFLSNPGKEHLSTVKWILEYLKGTSRLSLCFGNGKHSFDGCTDANVVGDVDSRKSISRYLITYTGGAISSCNKATKICCIIHYKGGIYCFY